MFLVRKSEFKQKQGCLQGKTHWIALNSVATQSIFQLLKQEKITDALRLYVRSKHFTQSFSPQWSAPLHSKC